jgi:hypothetical protein
LEPATSAIRPQSLADVGHFFRDDFSVGPHEPEAPGMKFPEGPLSQGQLLASAQHWDWG